MLLSLQKAIAQNKTIAQFAIWKPNPGQDQSFENGYKKHLTWHKANNDPWSWYGWFISSGPRCGQFVDATFDHSWGDFDHSVKPGEDMADNELHVFPFATLQTVFKASYLKDVSVSNESSLKSKFLRLITLEVNDVSNGIKMLEKLKTTNTDIKTLMCYKIVDGGSLNQLLLLLGFNSFSEYEKAENLQNQLSAIESSFKMSIIKSITSETLVYSADMSLFPN
ncbi:hypothetical protein D3C80_584570 [compost metagenome]